MQEIIAPRVDEKTGSITGQAHAFEYPLLLAILQFGFMGLIFLGIFLFFASSPAEDLQKAKENFFGIGRWKSATLVLTHVFSVFWLQALMMPSQMMSLGLFAASRAVEIPTAAVVRSRIMSTPLGGHSLTTSAMMFSAAWLLFYAYSQIADCLCVWSGFGVALTGPALFMVYALVLTLPVVNSVCQEACMVQLEIQPLLMLALMNLFAFVIFLPLLVTAHVMGWEDVGEGVEMIVRYQEGTMLVVWLCVQMCFLSGATAALVCLVDSFWTTALHSMRVVFWWMRQLAAFYFFNSTLLSIAQPHSSLWSFIMLVGLLLAAAAVVSDSKAESHSEKLGKVPLEKYSTA
jgi:hypothetical protein